MMIITPSQHIHMQRRPTSLRPRIQPMMNHLTIQRSYHRSLEAKGPHEERSAGDIQYSAGKGFVQGAISEAVAFETGFGAEGGFEGVAEGDEGVFDGVVVVNYAISSSIPFSEGSSKGVNALAKSPLHLTLKLHPACFAHACSM